MVCDSHAAAGKFTRAAGDVYVGEFKDDKFNGKGEERGRETELAAGRGKTRGRARPARQRRRVARL